MRGWVASPGRALWAYGFAAGQGEFYNATAAQSARWLERVVVTFREMGLGKALGGFVPPAWLLSAAARAEVAKAPFLYIETLRGLEVGGQRFARRLIGWGTRSPFEAWVTSAYAELVVRRAPADVRLAIHPGDMSSPICVASIRRCIERLTRVSSARSYAEYLALKRRSLSQPARAL
jgi:predicted deacetylase